MSPVCCYEYRCSHLDDMSLANIKQTDGWRDALLDTRLFFLTVESI